jgi:DNA repair protein RadC
MTPNETNIIDHAIRILEGKASYSGSEEAITSPEHARKLAFLHLGDKPDEYFACAFLNTRHHLISFEKLFRGTIDGASVHPRVLVRRSLELNAAAVILAHNHPSGISEPSQADQQITEKIKNALALVDVRVLDHLVIGSRLEDTVSFAERGLI